MTLDPRTPASSRSTLAYRMGAQDANIAGNVHGGTIMKLCDDAGAIAATRHCGTRVVTATVDQMKFRSAVLIGQIVTLKATVNAAWRTSMEVGVRVESEDVRTGHLSHTSTAYLTFVALDDEGRPVEAALAPESADEERRQTAANLRRELRLAGTERLEQLRQPAR